MSLHIPFDNSYARLPERFYHRQPASAVAKPGLIAVNHSLAQDLGIDPDALESPKGIAALAGNALPDGADPLAQAYAGHQFGGWSPQLGDGRALLLGEVIDRFGTRRDIQLKGSGPTPFSRMGDGRAGIGPVIREYLVSEAMHAMGIPTTRALAAISTGEPVIREQVLPGAVLTRVASSHIRVGTFQYFAARGDEEALQLLTEHTMARHYPEAEDALALLRAVITRQANLIAGWMGLGFIHGVMNTDNAQVAGETIDYGPCAFMDVYQASKVFSSIDHYGRYAYVNQPNIAVWNLAQFATCLLPLIHKDRETAAKLATEAVHSFPAQYTQAWLARFRAKLGLTGAEDEDGDGDEALIDGLLDAMEDGQADFTNCFAGLSEESAEASFADPAPWRDWLPAYQARLARQGGADLASMAQVNPKIIPRNHLVEEAIQAAQNGDYAPFQTLLSVITRPFEPPQDPKFQTPPRPEQTIAQTFCGT
ncbi:MAG: YdiU family protein [Mangrovicoccus sp.]|nr:YdiU family protein [Mangrovicoccus sp.]